MINNVEYQKITKDIAGSRVKNRFFYEMYYGIKKIYDLYQEGNDDFFVIFDYACDIEVGTKDFISFYQLKTKENHLTLNELLKSSKKEKSILQKLIDLNTSNSVLNLVIVSNNTLHGVDSEQTKFSNIESFCFNSIDNDYKKQINSCVKWPNDIEELDKVMFITSDLCLKKPSNSLQSYTNGFLDSLFPKSPQMVNYFEQVLISKVKEKATYEYDTLTLDDVIQFKGISKKDMDGILKDYSDEVINSSMVNHIAFDNKLSLLCLNIGDEISIKKEYSTIISHGYINEQIKKTCYEIISRFSTDEYKYLDEKKAIYKILDDENIDFSYCYSNKYLKIAIVILALIKG